MKNNIIQEKINYEGWQNCIKLSNKNIELILTTDVGPRIIRLGFIGGQNLLYLSQTDKGKTGGDSWRIYGGHRLWHSPEVMPRTYFPDNNPVDYSWNGRTLKLIQKIENSTGIIKEMEITLDPEKNIVTILHRLINKNLWDVELSAWAITAHAPGGKAIVPQEPYIDPADFLLPARPVVLWYYTHMNDPRWKWGNKYIQLMHDSSLKSEQKIGILNKQGWAAYSLYSEVLIKRFQFDPKARYEDYGCNNELYVNGDLLEVESLGPVTRIAPEEALEHTEKWLIAKLPSSLTDTHENSIDQILLPLVNKFLTEKYSTD